MRQKIVVVVGPTAVGKTALGIKLAQEYDGEVISGDSMQVYRGLDIGTAKVTPQEAEGVPHHLIDERHVSEAYSVSDFQNQARCAIRDIRARGKMPIIVGGTGLYIESLLYDVSHGGEAHPDMAFRQEMEQLAADYSCKAVWEKLQAIDPEAAQLIHPNNLRRVIRALEVNHVTGQCFSAYQRERECKTAVYDALIIGLHTERQVLYERINQRIDDMMVSGLIDEVTWLYNTVEKDAQSVQGIGYKELFAYIDGIVDLDEAVTQIKQASRRYAKRQLTWFRNRTPVDMWIDVVEHPQELEMVLDRVQQFWETC